MTFENYRDNIIEDFEEDIINNNLGGKLSEEQREAIIESFEEHRECYEHKDEFDADDEELFVASSYLGNNGKVYNIAIECMQCNSVIADNETLEDI